MQAQTPPEIDWYLQAREQFEQLLGWLESDECPRTLSGVERELRARALELMRASCQGMLDSRSERERAQAAVATREPGVVVRSRSRGIEADFGRLRLKRLGYKRKGQPAVFPLDRELNLPTELYSHQVRQRVAFEAQRGSWDDAVSTVQRTSAAHVPKRQAEQLAARAARDFDTFYEQRVQPSNDVLGPTALNVASADSKGVTMLHKGLREATRKAAEQEKASRQRSSPMAPKKLHKHDKRMAIVTANWQQERQPRTAEQVLANLDRKPGQKKLKGPRPQDKRVRASVYKSQAEGLREMFDELERRDPQRERTTAVLVDGEGNQLEEVKKQAQSRGLSITIILDIIHAISYLWLAGSALCRNESTDTETWVRARLRLLLTGTVSQVIGTIRRQATMLKLSEKEREPVETCCQYLWKNQPFLRYAEYLAQGFPIATGVIEGACRHLVEDRMGITGARWDVDGAESVLRLRALRCSGDWDEYWRFHERQEFIRNHSSTAA